MVYASFAFANGLTKKHTKELGSVQSLSMRLMCNLRLGIPLKGLEVILDVPPINLFLFIKAEAAKSHYRMIGINCETVARKGHLTREKGP